MRLDLTGRHVDITPDLRRLVTSKLGKLERLLNDRGVSAQVVLTRERYRHRTDITLHARGEQFLHAFAASSAWGASVNEALERVSQQVKKMKGKFQGRKRDGDAKAAAAVDGAPTAVAVRPARASRSARARLPRTMQTSRQPMRTMSVADAAREVDANGDDLVLFIDVETASVSALYRRTNGELALVQTET